METTVLTTKLESQLAFFDLTDDQRYSTTKFTRRARAEATLSGTDDNKIADNTFQAITYTGVLKVTVSKGTINRKQEDPTLPILRCDPYVKVTFNGDTKETETKTDDFYPDWNTLFEFPAFADDQDRSLTIELWDKCITEGGEEQLMGVGRLENIDSFYNYLQELNIPFLNKDNKHHDADITVTIVFS